MKLFSFLFILLLTLLFISCKNGATLFTSIPESSSGIHFSNTITENDSINILNYEYVYNGGGVGTGDFNRDGLTDVYFSGNMVGNQLYLNKGKMEFKNVTAESGTAGEGKWCNGVTVVDINNDGWPDIFISASRSSDPEKRKKILYINKGLDKNGIPVFKNEAAAYGLDDTSYSTSAAFFDYDNDGDLDMFLLVAGKLQVNKNPDAFSYNLVDTSNLNTSKLFQNNWDKDTHHPYFTDVSRVAGITKPGYGLGVNITDINKDGWKDILVSNDYLSNDILWINNGNGTFTDKSKEYFKHTSFSAMGNEVEDINNDGLADIVELDMSPEDNYRKKMMVNPNTYQVNLNFDRYGYQYQYERNTLQLNGGNRIGEKDSVGAPVFSEISYYSGIANTDWSWTPLVADFDNDSYKDIIITNGFPKDLSDHDFISYRDKASSVASKEILIQQMAEVKLKNYAFHNNRDLTFSNVSDAWGIAEPSFSNGAAYADFDNDGDLDYIVNNINGVASVYKNNLRETNKSSSNFLNVVFVGEDKNINGLGAFIDIYYDHGKHQFWENTPYRGYLSTVEDIAHFGLGTILTIDSVVISWPNRKKQLLQNVKANQSLSVNIKNALLPYSFNIDKVDTGALFTNVTEAADIHYIQKEKDFIDFNIQKLLPHKFSEFGPGMAAGDINGDGIDDIITGGSLYHSGQKFIQQKNGKFIQTAIETIKDSLSKNVEDEGVLLFDADGDGDLDLYIASGSYEWEHNSLNYQDRFFINDGKGNYTADSSALPKNFTSKFCVRAIDYDKDGDLDLFVSGRVDPWNYPKPVSSFILRNDTKNGIIKFTDVTSTVAKDLLNIGLVCDAVFTDFNNDGWTDLVLAGEWMPVTFLKNDKGVFKNVTPETGVGNEIGWWNTIAAGDFDNDGDIDYIVGNTGLNTFYKASSKYPVSIYSKDFNNDGKYDAITSVYLQDNSRDKNLKEFPAFSRDELIRQMISMRRQYNNYKSYAVATMDSLLSPTDRQGALVYHANNIASCYLRNEGNGKFSIQNLPLQAQLSPLSGMCVTDFDGDGNLDVIINGNDYGTEVTTGRYDALNGLMLKGDGKGNFVSQTMLQSGIYIPGNGKSLVQLQNNGGNLLIAAAENKGPLRLFKLKKNFKNIITRQNETYAILYLKDGKMRKQEIYYGTSFLSQSSRFISIDSNVKSVKLFDKSGETRTINFN